MASNSPRLQIDLPSNVASARPSSVVTVAVALVVEVDDTQVTVEVAVMDVVEAVEVMVDVAEEVMVDVAEEVEVVVGQTVEKPSKAALLPQRTEGASAFSATKAACSGMMRSTPDRSLATAEESPP